MKWLAWAFFIILGAAAGVFLMLMIWFISMIWLGWPK